MEVCGGKSGKPKKYAKLYQKLLEHPNFFSDRVSNEDRVEVYLGVITGKYKKKTHELMKKLYDVVYIN